ncbi:carboxylesterase [Parashewanella spongiae]|uniref:Carboxylesterase n=1 Tax=Parashewanella spongiae TaxID=342950 RepID=A0A3A6TVJ2_9GAMM|nr:carboxylesterase [Parashewanella spongiae]MCL1077614.1 alpha/beta hydrolase [Parashewanella spongiae]RJY13158.1 carboxylesterase [Parashewanella spongiae]
MSLDSNEAIVVEPDTKATACVIWLHGLGDSGAGFAPVVPMLGLPQDHSVRFIFPHAPEQPVTINGGAVMRSWYDIKSMNLLERADLDGVKQSELKVKRFIESQMDSGIQSENIILAGFSQGGVLSLFTGLRLPYKLAGIMALSCYLPAGDKLPEGINEVNKDTPVLQHHGQQDPVVPVDAGKMANTALINAGYLAEWKSYPMPHSVLPQQLAEIGQWLSKQLNV